MNLLQSFIISMSMYSRIPMPKVEWENKNMKYVMCFFPLVGLVIGLILWLAGSFLLGTGCGSLFFGAVMTLIPVLVTGGIHLDGFMDTMDALGSYGDQNKKLAILKDSHAGAFAILGICCYFLWSMAVWSEVTAKMLPVIGCGYVISRALSGLSVVSYPPARNSGLAATFQKHARQRQVQVVLIVYVLVAGGAMLFFNVTYALAAISACSLVFCYYKKMSEKQFGGITGDLAGYFLQLCELSVTTFVVLAGGVLW